VVTQVALTLVLLVVAGLLMRVVTRYRDSDLGFNPAQILSVKLGLSRARYEGRDMVAAFYGPLEERVKRLPGVQAAGLIDVLPIDSFGDNRIIHIAGGHKKGHAYTGRVQLWIVLQLRSQSIVKGIAHC